MKDRYASHDFDDGRHCSRCSASRIEVDDALAPIPCAGSPDWRTAWKDLAAMTSERDMWKALAGLRGGVDE